MSNDEITARLEASRSEIMGSSFQSPFGEVSKDVKYTRQKVTENSITIARVEGKLETHGEMIGRNKDDIAENKKAIEKVRDNVRGMLIKASATGGVVGSMAGFLAGLLGG